jgi:hypothetical protein
MKTSELTGAALDWAVAMAIGDYTPVRVPTYSTDWAHGGVIIERERITVIAMPNGSWATSTPLHTFHQPTPLIAAMRCYVASKLGDNVELPEGL